MKCICFLLMFFSLQLSAFQTCPSEEINTNGLLSFLNESSRRIFETSSSVLTYRPSQSLQGFGNLMVGTYGMILLANFKAQVPLIAHSMVASMFHHPLSFEGITFQKLMETDGIISLPTIQESGSEVLSVNGPEHTSHINVLGTGDNLMTSPVREFYAHILNMSSSDPRLYDVMSSTAAEWMLSNPSPRFMQIYENFKAAKLAQCPTDRFNFGIQIRSWIDWKSYYSFFENNKPCIVQCIASTILDTIRRDDSSAAKTRSMEPCIFFTSDSAIDADDIIQQIKESINSVDPTLRIKFVLSELPSQTVAEIEHSKSYAAKSPNDMPFSWRSDFVLRTSRQSFNEDDLWKRTDLLDWMLFGDVNIGIYTAGSTFGRTARMRKGYSAQAKDRIVTTRGVAGLKTCICKAVQPEDHSSIKYNGLGVMVVP